MTGATHKLGGLAAGIFLIYITGQNDLPTETVILMGSVLGSLVPDIDNPRSSISMRFPLVRMGVGAGQGIVRGIAAFLPRKLQKHIRSLAGHRGMSHSPCMAVLLSGLVLLAGQIMQRPSLGWMAAGLFVGMISHIILDMFAGGVPLGMPFTTVRVTLARIKTGGLVELLIRSAAIAFGLSWFAGYVIYL